MHRPADVQSDSQCETIQDYYVRERSAVHSSSSGNVCLSLSFKPATGQAVSWCYPFPTRGAVQTASTSIYQPGLINWSLMPASSILPTGRKPVVADANRRLTAQLVTREGLFTDSNANREYNQAVQSKVSVGAAGKTSSKELVQAISEILNALGWNAVIRQRPTTHLIPMLVGV